MDRRTEHNITNSLAVYLAGLLAAEGYLIYWFERDALQTPDGLYPQYLVNQATYLADATVAARVSAAKGLLTIAPKMAAIPRYVTRRTNDGTVEAQYEVPVPALSVSVSESVTVMNYEMGSRLKWRARHLELAGKARDKWELANLSDLLASWFDQDLALTIYEHDLGTLADVGDVTIGRSAVLTDIDDTGAEAATFDLVLHARLDYVA